MNARKTDPNAESSEADVADLTKPRLLAWVKDGARTGEELATVCGRFPEIDRVLASHPNIKAETLSSLSHSGDKATRARVAANPATPAVDLLRLGQQFPKEFLGNPALDLLMLENPALLDNRFNRTYRHEVLDAYVFKSIEQVQDITEEWLRVYNEQRPRDALGGLPPKQFLPRLTTAADSRNRRST